MIRVKTLFFTLLIGLSLVTPLGVDADSQAQGIQPAWAQSRQERAGDNSQRILSVRDVVEIVRGRFGGELISARLEQSSRPFYVLRWRFPNESVEDIRVDAATGQVSR
ncbi:MAG: hypothetical protein WDM79_13120 [Terricaulis sp.]